MERLRRTSLMNSCTPTADVAGRQHLRSTSQRKLSVPRYRLNSFGRRRFAVAGPSTWNSLPDSLHDPALSLNMFRRQLKTYFLRNIDEMYQRIRDLLIMRYINRTLYFTLLYKYVGKQTQTYTGAVRLCNHHHHYSACTISVRSSACYQ